MSTVTSRHLLDELAAHHGVATAYTAQSGEHIAIDAPTIIGTLRALGVGIPVEPSDDDITLQLYWDYQAAASRPLPACVVATAGNEEPFLVHVPAGAPAEVTVELENGRTAPTYQDPNDSPDVDIDGKSWGEASFHVPGDLPLGYHELHLRSEDLEASCPLIVVPSHLDTADELLTQPGTGVMAQLYSVRSAASWGMGDFHDLGAVAELVAEHADADFLLVNPLHAAEPFPPVEDSPYLPTTRRFINPLYLRVEDVPELALLDADTRADVDELAAEFRLANNTAQVIDRDAIFDAKLQVLRELFFLDHTEERRAQFREFTRTEGAGLAEFARWCAEAELAAQAGRRHRQQAGLDQLTEYYSWLQFLCAEQLGAAQDRARAAGMRVGIIMDLAVGIHPGGADAVNLAEYLAPLASVGAPPDEYNQLGQDWSQPPWHPVRLAEAGYGPWRDLLRTAMRRSGGLRVDHILGLFRLYWIQRGLPPTAGTYVRYDSRAMVGILALEAQRTGTVVIGEDLGTVEESVRGELARFGILGTNVVWFEKAGDTESARASAGYRRLALVAVGTHDMPPTLSYLRGGHITLREELGMLTRPAEVEDAEDRAWQQAVFNQLAAEGFLDPAVTPRPDDELAVVEALHRFAAATPAALTVTNLVDMVGDTRAQNQPGTTRDLYPNWCVPLCDSQQRPVLLEDIAGQPLFARLAAAASRAAR